MKQNKSYMITNPEFTTFQRTIEYLKDDRNTFHLSIQDQNNKKPVISLN